MIVNCIETCTHSVGGVEQSFQSGMQYAVDDELGEMLVAFPTYFVNPNAPAASAPTENESAALEDLTIPQLREIAEEGGIDLTGISLKGEIVAAIQAARDDD